MGKTSVQGGLPGTWGLQLSGPVWPLPRSFLPSLSTGGHKAGEHRQSEHLPVLGLCLEAEARTPANCAVGEILPGWGWFLSKTRPGEGHPPPPPSQPPPTVLLVLLLITHCLGPAGDGSLSLPGPAPGTGRVAMLASTRNDYFLEAGRFPQSPAPLAPTRAPLDANRDFFLHVVLPR